MIKRGWLPCTGRVTGSAVLAIGSSMMIIVGMTTYTGGGGTLEDTINMAAGTGNIPMRTH